MIRCLRLFTLLTVLSGGAVSAQSLPDFREFFQKQKAQEVKTKESKNFRVSWVHPRDEIFVDALLTHAELAHESLVAPFSGSFPLKEKVPVEIFPDLRSFSEVSGLPLARFKASGTIALTLDQRLMLLSPRNSTGGYNWATTVVHELIHYLIRTISRDHVPIWLHEGTAQVYQGYPYRKDENLSPAQWGVFKKAKRGNRLLSLKTLMEPFPYRKDPEETELAYIQALLFAKWLQNECGLVPLIQQSEALKSVNKALSICANKPFEKLETAFIPEILSKVQIPDLPEVEFYARDFSQGDPAEVESRKVDRAAKNFAQLSNELFQQGRFQAATIEMRKALSKTPARPPSWNRQLALSYLKLGKKKESQAALESVLRDYPDDAASWFLIGNLEIESAPEEAWQSFLKAFFVNPFLDGLHDQMSFLREKNPEFTYSLR